MESNEKVTLEQIDGQAQELAEQQNTTPVKKKTRKYTALKIIAPILYGIVTAFLLYTYIDSMATANPDTQGLSFALWVVIIFLIMGTAGYVASIIPAAIGLILTLAHKRSGIKKGQLIYFIVFTVLPVLTWFAIYFLCTL